MSYKLNEEDVGAILQVLSEDKKESINKAMDEIEEDNILKRFCYMQEARLFIESILLSAIETYETEIKPLSKDEARVELGMMTNRASMMGVEGIIKILMGVDPLYEDDDDAEGLDVEDIPEEMLEEISKATGLTVEELRDRGLVVNVAREDENGDLKILSDSDSREIIKEVPYDEYHAIYANGMKMPKSNKSKDKSNKPKDMKDIIAELDKVRKEL